jgi:adenylate cyclase
MTTPPDHDPDFSGVLGAPREFTSSQVSERVGIPTYRARRYWRALGFANVPDGDREFTNSDINALSALLGLVDEGVLSETPNNRTCQKLRPRRRTPGDLPSRELGQVPRRRRSLRRRTVPAVHQRVDRRLPEFEKLLIYTWRRHLLVAMQRLRPHVDIHDRAKVTVASWISSVLPK